MNPKEKALDLYNKFRDKLPVLSGNIRAKQCALICIEEMLQVIPMYIGNLNPTWKYWNEVKEELLKL